MKKINEKKSKRENKKGQVALEALIVIAFVLLLMSPLLYLLYQRSNEVRTEIQILQAVRAADALASTVSIVGMNGKNSSAVAEITLPENIKNITIGDASPFEIVIVVDTSLGDIEIVRVVKPFNITGKINVVRGQQTVNVIYPEEGLPIQISA
jgi:uncharacterized protein (UPF0333 family)